MTHIGDFIFACDVTNVVDLIRSVVLCHLPKTKVEELLGIHAIVRVEGVMLPTVLVRSVVPAPDVIAQFSKVECC